MFIFTGRTLHQGLAGKLCAPYPLPLHGAHVTCIAEEEWRDKDDQPLMGDLFIMCLNSISQVTKATKQDLVWLPHEDSPHRLQLEDDETPRGYGVTKAIAAFVNMVVRVKRLADTNHVLVAEAHQVCC